MSIVTASIVLYKTKKEQIEKIINVLAESNSIHKLFVIDNCSTEETKNYISQFDFIEYIPHENTGYGSSHNIGLKKAEIEKSDYHIVLNPDIEFEPSVLAKLINFMENNQNVGYLLPKVIYPNGELQYLCRRLPKPIDLFARRFCKKLKIMKDIDNRYSLKSFSYEKIINPPCLSGCFMLLNMKILLKNNLFFDDRFFMYFEDFDLIRRIHKVSKTIYYPYEVIVHAHARESHNNRKMFWIFVKSLIKYFNKWGWFFDFERYTWNREIDLEISKVDKK